MDQKKLIAKVLKEHGVAAEEALAAMVGVMVERHLDVELRRAGKRPAYPIHNERADALKAMNDALHQAIHSGRQKDATLGALRAVLIECQFAAEKQAGLEEEDDEAGPTMRLHRPEE